MKPEQKQEQAVTPEQEIAPEHVPGAGLAMGL
jgi:hypothetical protein